MQLVNRCKSFMTMTSCINESWADAWLTQVFSLLHWSLSTLVGGTCKIPWLPLIWNASNLQSFDWLSWTLPTHVRVYSVRLNHDIKLPWNGAVLFDQNSFSLFHVRIESAMRFMTSILLSAVLVRRVLTKWFLWWYWRTMKNHLWISLNMFMLYNLSSPILHYPLVS